MMIINSISISQQVYELHKTLKSQAVPPPAAVPSPAAALAPTTVMAPAAPVITAEAPATLARATLAPVAPVLPMPLCFTAQAQGQAAINYQHIMANMLAAQGSWPYGRPM